MNDADYEIINNEILGGKLDSAREKAFAFLRKDPKDYLAWYLLSKCWEDIQARMECLQSALSINPRDKRITSEYALVKQQYDKSPYRKKSPSNSKKKVNKRKIEKQEADLCDLENSCDHDPKRVDYKVYVRKPEDDFFYGQETGVDPSSRMESGIFGKHIIVDGISISSSDLPQCLRVLDPSPDDCCENCDFFISKNCLLRFDEFFAHEIYTLNKLKFERQVIMFQRSRLVAKIIFDELKKHGRALHYSVICRMVVDRYPKLNLNKQEVYQFMLMHPEIIERVGEGVYQAK